MKSYSEYMTNASDYKDALDQATSDHIEKDVIYFRGKYLYALKQAYKVNNTGIVPAAVRNQNCDVNIEDEIQIELANHQRQLAASIRNNKAHSNIANPTLSREVGLKIRRLATYCSQANFATGAVERQAATRNIAKSSFALGGSALKAPIMATTKVVSKIGPLAITVLALPFALLSSFLRITFDASDGKVADGTEAYNNSLVTQMSNGLKKGVQGLSNFIYKGVGRL